ncbi:HTH DNA binding protein [Gordonia phage Eyre]|uniref:HTH DNA binding protein n=1 Tax=Gordonia phage Eyre TaxID=1887646 RepID=A0A1B3AZY7_9CAUD|nr:replication initiation protein [Gordonia phage Eyre]AOE44337.1 HTH DNA binding protein [Gordonia phage Eyre]
MAKATGKDHARVNLDIWNDDDWLDLSPAAQHLYLVLWTSPGLTYCGAGDWRPRKIAQRASGWTVRGVELAAAELARERFVIIDADTEEFLLRSWMKHDGLWKQPNMAVSMANARADLASRTLRGVVVFEVLKIREEHPEMGGWNRDALVDLLAQRPVDPATVRPFRPDADPSVDPSADPPVDPKVDPYAYPSVNHQPRGKADPSVDPGPTPSPSPAPISILHSPAVPESSHQGAVELAPRRGTRASKRIAELNATSRSGVANQFATQFANWAGGGIPQQSLIEIAQEVDQLIRDGIDAHQIAEGVKAWHGSDRVYPSQIPHFVTKAAKSSEPQSKPTKATERAVDTITTTERLIAEFREANR